MNAMRKTPLLIILLPLLTFICHHTASAYYDPGVQRWINRDPVGELGFEIGSRSSVSEVTEEMNCYRFLANEPVESIDSWGLSLASVITGIFDKWGYGNSCGWSRRGQLHNTIGIIIGIFR